MKNVIGRAEEMELLEEALQSRSAALMAVYGRRRVGKTYLIHSYFEKDLVFELTGMSKGGMKEQLAQFSRALQKASGATLQMKPPSTWIEAFHALEQFLAQRIGKKKLVVFLDEFPWLDSRKSGFLSAFEHFWNSWASRQPKLLVVICGSAASWMIKNIVNNKGGLHNRITHKLRVMPFTLADSEQYLASIGSKLDRYQVLQLYMSFGGIPHYLNAAAKGRSAAQSIEKACFKKDGLLDGEFNNLYSSLFDMADNHIKVVRTLASTPKGLTRQELIVKCGLTSGGRTTTMLQELEESGFIKAFYRYDKTVQDSIYRLIDEFSIFYLKFMDKKRSQTKNVWLKLSSTPTYATWTGMAFESVCLKHLDQIKKKLGIEQIETQEGAWRYKPLPGKYDKGTQIDLLIDRQDRCINICEIKFYTGKFTIDKSYADELQNRLKIFAQKTKTKKSLFLTFISTYGLNQNVYAARLVHKSITMDALFEI